MASTTHIYWRKYLGYDQTFQNGENEKLSLIRTDIYKLHSLDVSLVANMVSEDDGIAITLTNGSEKFVDGKIVFANTEEKAIKKLGVDNPKEFDRYFGFTRITNNAYITSNTKYPQMIRYRHEPEMKEIISYVSHRIYREAVWTGTICLEEASALINSALDKFGGVNLGITIGYNDDEKLVYNFIPYFTMKIPSDALKRLEKIL